MCKYTFNMIGWDNSGHFNHFNKKEASNDVWLVVTCRLGRLCLAAVAVTQSVCPCSTRAFFPYI